MEETGGGAERAAGVLVAVLSDEVEHLDRELCQSSHCRQGTIGGGTKNECWGLELRRMSERFRRAGVRNALR